MHLVKSSVEKIKKIRETWIISANHPQANHHALVKLFIFYDALACMAMRITPVSLNNYGTVKFKTSLRVRFLRLGFVKPV